MSAPLCIGCGYWTATVGSLCEACAETAAGSDERQRLQARTGSSIMVAVVVELPPSLSPADMDRARPLVRADIEAAVQAAADLLGEQYPDFEVHVL